MVENNVVIHPKHDYYLDCTTQICECSNFLRRYGGEDGFRPSDIPDRPSGFVPRTPTERPLLAIILPKKGWMDGIQRTWEDWWSFFTPAPGHHKLMSEFQTNSEFVQPISGDHRSGMRWVGYDLCANYGKSPASCWADSAIAPHLATFETLIAAAIMPRFFDELGLASIALSGFKYYNPCAGWNAVPILFSGVKGDLRLSNCSSSESHDLYSPVVRDL
jgi:hypothetical protein